MGRQALFKTAAVVLLFSFVGYAFYSNSIASPRSSLEEKEFALFAQSDIPLQNAKYAKGMQIVDVKDGQKITLTADIVQKNIGENKFTMYGYNESVPGPILKVAQHSEITLEFKNNINFPTTVHWHGVRLDNAFDGVPGTTQEEIQPKDSFTYTITFPDAGIYWYHPHVREDIQQDLGLYGIILVEPKNKRLPANREEVLILDDILVKNGAIHPYGKEMPNLALMGRFGNTMLVNGETEYSLSVNKGDVVRFYLANVANVRPYNISFSEAKMKLVGTDVSNYQTEEFVDSIVISPAERYIVDILFDKTGTFEIQNINPQETYTLGTITVSEAESQQKYLTQFSLLGSDPQVTEEIESYHHYFDDPVRHTFDLTVDIAGMSSMDHAHMMSGIEWEDTMPGMNQGSTGENTRWIIKDRETGKENMDIAIRLQQGEIVKIRIFNDDHSMHPMQHPIHIHGQRFLVLSTNGIPNDNLAWKDTVLVAPGQSVDLLVEATNPGEWMFHCHIAEHLSSGMMASFTVGDIEKRAMH